MLLFGNDWRLLSIVEQRLACLLRLLLFLGCPMNRHQLIRGLLLLLLVQIGHRDATGADLLILLRVSDHAIELLVLANSMFVRPHLIGQWRLGALVSWNLVWLGRARVASLQI